MKERDCSIGLVFISGKKKFISCPKLVLVYIVRCDGEMKISPFVPKAGLPLILEWNMSTKKMFINFESLISQILVISTEENKKKIRKTFKNWLWWQCRINVWYHIILDILAMTISTSWRLVQKTIQLRCWQTHAYCQIWIA